MAKKTKNPNAPIVPKFALAKSGGKKTIAAKLSITTCRIENLVSSVDGLLAEANKQVEGIVFARGTINLYKV